MTAETTVSVVIPMHNAGPYVGEALESIEAQAHAASEIIVIDDGSTDGGGEAARAASPAAKVVAQPRRGDAAARNRGIELATGRYLAFLDADDRWAPSKTALQLDALQAHPEADLVFGLQRQFRSPELGAEDAQFAGDDSVQVARTAGTMLVRREIFDRVGPFAGFRMGTFLDWLARSRDLGLRELVLDQVVLERRLHPGGHSLQERAHIAEYARILKRSLDRRREAGSQ